MTQEYVKKEFKFKGKTIEELKNLDVREFAKMLPSRQRRTILRNFQDLEGFLKRAKKKNEKGKPVKTHHRSYVIVPQLVGMKVGIYNGREFVMIEIVGEMLGHKLGEFAPTRVKTKHSKTGAGGTKGSRPQSKH
jgi:small subunit ribosomal protein S19